MYRHGKTNHRTVMTKADGAVGAVTPEISLLKQLNIKFDSFLPV
jgi:hypothetical protein